MNDDIKQIQGIKRFYDSNPVTTNAGYQPVAKKKKGKNRFFFNFIYLHSIGVPIVGTTLRELNHTSITLEPTIVDSRSRNCPYLDTINRYDREDCKCLIEPFTFRSLLDFDFEKLCSITLSNNNVYACLVCGKYFQGKF